MKYTLNKLANSKKEKLYGRKENITKNLQKGICYAEFMTSVKFLDYTTLIQKLV